VTMIHKRVTGAHVLFLHISIGSVLYPWVNCTGIRTLNPGFRGSPLAHGYKTDPIMIHTRVTGLCHVLFLHLSIGSLCHVLFLHIIIGSVLYPYVTVRERNAARAAVVLEAAASVFATRTQTRICIHTHTHMYRYT